jgi:biopolymer transport protein ExbD
MAISLEGTARGRRKALDADLNLVPYIDLLTCMVAFLLITAVWTQLARLEVLQKGQGGESSGEPPQTKIAVVVHDDGFTLIVDNDQKPLPRQSSGLDYRRLGVELAALKQAHPDKLDAEVRSEDQISFDVIVQTMDVARSAGFRDLSLLDAAAGG